MKFSKRKIIKITALSVLAAILLTLIGYILYVFLSYYRVDDNQSLEIGDNTDKALSIDKTFTLTTYNIGFGAYSDDYSFFMDGGKYSRAFDEQAVRENTSGALNAIIKENPDFALFQEVDIDGTRSYHVNQLEMLSEQLVDFDLAFAQNYDSPYFFYPFNSPIGANKSGIATFSNFNIESALRRQLPIEDSFNKLIDLDRCYSISRIPTENGKYLVLYNVHLSAYTSDGTIANEQLQMLSDDMSCEYEKGNYVIAAGDFNKDLLGDSSKYFERAEGEFNWAQPIDTSLLPDFITCVSGENIPTCRNADSAYRADGTDFVLSVDGFLVSDNVEITLCETIDTAFKFSDHNPVKLEFKLES